MRGPLFLHKMHTTYIRAFSLCGLTIGRAFRRLGRRLPKGGMHLVKREAIRFLKEVLCVFFHSVITK